MDSRGKVASLHLHSEEVNKKPKENIESFELHPMKKCGFDETCGWKRNSQ